MVSCEPRHFKQICSKCLIVNRDNFGPRIEWSHSNWSNEVKSYKSVGNRSFNHKNKRTHSESIIQLIKIDTNPPYFYFQNSIFKKNSMIEFNLKINFQNKSFKPFISVEFGDIQQLICRILLFLLVVLIQKGSWRNSMKMDGRGFRTWNNGDIVMVQFKSIARHL